MNSKSEYKTKQRTALINYFRSHADEQLSVSDIVNTMCNEHGIGKSTVYRLVSKLNDEGILMRFRDGNRKQVVYRYVDSEHGCNQHFHLKCTDCGKMVHLDDKSTGSALINILKENNFSSNEGKTILFGKCKKCEVEFGQ